MELEKKPFWVSDQEVQGLGTVPPTPADKLGVKKFGKELGGDVASAVPSLKMIKRERIYCEWGIKDGLVNYHFYLPARYEIRAEAEEQMEAARKSCSREQLPAAQQAIADHYNPKLAEHPWPQGMDAKINNAKSSVFPYGDYKVAYFGEVDSFSLVFPEPTKGFVDDRRYESVITVLDQSMVDG